MAAFMARIDERNFHKDLAQAAREEGCADHECRIKNLEKKATRIETVAYGTPAVAGIAWFFLKIGHLLAKDIKLP